jgi:hypothetical protein
MISSKWIYYACAYIALMLIAIAVWPDEGGQIQRAGIGLLFVIMGAFSVLRPEQVRTNMAARQISERTRESVESTGIWFFRFIGIVFVLAGAYTVLTGAPLNWRL